MILEEAVLAGIIEFFDKDCIKYVCIANEREEEDMVPRLHVQILLYKRRNTTKKFMAKCVGMFLFFIPLDGCFLSHQIDCGCQYQVTTADAAWNEYLKKGRNLKSTTCMIYIKQSLLIKDSTSLSIKLLMVR